MNRKSGSGIRHPFPRLSLISYPSHDEERGERSVTRDPETGAERHTSSGHGDALGIRIMMEGAEEMRLESEQENLNRGNQSSGKK